MNEWKGSTTCSQLASNTCIRRCQGWLGCHWKKQAQEQSTAGAAARQEPPGSSSRPLGNQVAPPRRPLDGRAARLAGQARPTTRRISQNKYEQGPTHVVDDGPLKPGHHEVRAFLIHRVLDAPDAVEHNGSAAGQAANQSAVVEPRAGVGGGRQQAAAAAGDTKVPKSNAGGPPGAPSGSLDG